MCKDFTIKNGSLFNFSDLTATSVVIPSNVNIIEKEVFRWRKNIKNIVIPNSVKIIKDGAFSHCESLESITIPESVISIGKNVFDICENLKDIVFLCNVDTIEECSFRSCKSLKSITLPKRLKYIKDRAFENCESLKYIEIPENVVNIGSEAFENCIKLKQVVLPSKCVNIKDRAFSNCKEIESISFLDKEEKEIPNQNNNHYKIETKAFSNCTKLKTMSIPYEITSIGERAFEYCSCLDSVTFPNTVSYIGANAFINCKNLKSLSIPSNNFAIDEAAFCECSNLESICLGSCDITSGNNCIGPYAFMYCTNLITIKLYEGLKVIYESAFTKCNLLRNVKLPQSLEIMQDEAFEKAVSFIDYPKKVWINRYPYDDHFPDVKKIYPEELTKEQKYTLLELVCDTYLNDKEASNEWKKKWLSYLKKQKKSLYEKVFDLPSFLELCCKEKVFNLENTKELIDISTQNQTVNITAILMDYMSSNFTKESREKGINIEKDIEKELSKIWSYKKKEDNTLIITNYKGTDEIIHVPSVIGKREVSELDSFLFSPEKQRISKEEKAQRSLIKEIHIPDSIKIINEGLIKGCTNIENVTIPKNIKGICENDFIDLCYEQKNLKSIVIPKGCESILDTSFSNYNNLEYIHFPSSIKHIGSSLFYNCKKLKQIEIAKDNQNFTFENGIIYDKNKTAIYCPESKKEDKSFDSSFLTVEPKLMDDGTYGTFGTDGKYVLFGFWPQSIKDEKVIIDEKFRYNKNGFECYKGSDGCYYVKQEVDDLGSDQYYFSNGAKIYKGNSYYFKMESIKWRIIDENYEGGKLILCENILTNLPYKNSYNETNKYKDSIVRAFLEGLDGSSYKIKSFKSEGFIDKAFCESSLEYIKEVKITDEDNNKIGVSKAFLLTYKDLKNTKKYGFMLSSKKNDEHRIRTVTDYAIAKGADTDNIWWLRTPSIYNDSYVMTVSKNGRCDNSNPIINKSCGVVPAMVIVL